MYGLVYSLVLYLQTIHSFYYHFIYINFLFITLYSAIIIIIYIFIKIECIVCIVCIVFGNSLREIWKNNS